MKILTKAKDAIPKPIKEFLLPIRCLISNKYVSEMAFWNKRLEIDHGIFQNFWYERLMLAMAGELDETFLTGKIIADFGCGPRGSLTWASSASLRIGIDVLADRYADNFRSNVISYCIKYAASTEKVIPIPSDFVDIIFTLNALDHVDSFPTMCKEILRVLKPGGDLIASFNLEEPAAPCEPQKLNEQIIRQHLLDFLKLKAYRISKRGPENDLYAPFFEGDLSYKKGEKGFLWVRASKPTS